MYCAFFFYRLHKTAHTPWQTAVYNFLLLAIRQFCLPAIYFQATQLSHRQTTLYYKFTGTRVTVLVKLLRRDQIQVIMIMSGHYCRCSFARSTKKQNKTKLQ